MQLKSVVAQTKKIIKNSWYVYCMEKKPVVPGRILLESRKGDDVAGNILRIMQEISETYGNEYHMFLAVSGKLMGHAKKLLDSCHICGVKLVEFYGMKYFEILATAEYLINDTCFPRRFVKRDGQKYLNVWHGTPFKKMGKDIPAAAYCIGNIQRNLLVSDFLLYPSEYMRKIMEEGYNLKNLYQGTYVYGGYPRNQVFFDTEGREALRKKLKLAGKRVYCYMPTWRGAVVVEDCKGERLEHEIEMIRGYLEEMDRRLNDREVMLLRLHPIVGQKISCSGFRHIRLFPEGYEPYTILNLADCLVTDYSSVFYDYANKQDGKIVLFLYDWKEYQGERDFYGRPEDLPFPIVENIQNLMEELRTPKQYDSREFLQTYCAYDGIDAARAICRLFLKGEISDQVKLEKPVQDKKKKILFYVGGLQQNGMTSAFLNLIDNMNPEKYHYYACFQEEYLKKTPLRVKMIPDFVEIVPMSPGWDLTIKEGIACFLYYKGNFDSAWIRRQLKHFYGREYRRNFAGSPFDWCIHYNGYERKVISLFQEAPCKKAIFVHNDMLMEIKTKNNQHLPTLKKAYREYDLVVAVSRDIYERTLKISRKKENLCVIYNWYSYKKIWERAGQEWDFDETTRCTCSREELDAFLKRPGRKMISIGRFSPEKRHDMLIDAFSDYHKKNPRSTLLIIGGSGELYDKTWKKIKDMGLKDSVVLIKSLQNPMPVLKSCDLFLLSSAYEGLPVVLFEANTLGVPSIAAEVVGTRGFMKEHGGYLVPGTKEGLLKGMEAFDRGEVKVMEVDYKTFNQKNLMALEKALG